MDEDYAFEPDPLCEDELSAEKSLRPASLEEFIGQKRVVENLRIAIETARSRGDTLDHVLFSGMPGLGKTTLAYLMASELRVDIRCTSGPAIEKPRDIVGLLTGLQKGDILFIDEIHRLTKSAEEFLYSAMEDQKVDVVLDRGADARAVRLTVEPFTLVGATTREGYLSAAFRSRFGILEKLEPYPPSEILFILQRSARILGCSLDEEGALLLARRCRGTPRYANRFLRRIRDIGQYRSLRGKAREFDRGLLLNHAHVAEGLDRLGVDENGLDRVDRSILSVLFQSTDAVGLKTIAMSIGEEERTIEDVHEPFLIQSGLIVKTPRGRRPSAKAHDLYMARGSICS